MDIWKPRIIYEGEWKIITTKYSISKFYPKSNEVFWKFRDGLWKPIGNNITLFIRMIWTIKGGDLQSRTQLSSMMRTMLSLRLHRRCASFTVEKWVPFSTDSILGDIKNRTAINWGYKENFLVWWISHLGWSVSCFVGCVHVLNHPLQITAFYTSDVPNYFILKSLLFRTILSS